MQEPTIYINIGLIGSGKTTFSNKKALVSPVLIVSKDSIRQMLFGAYRFEEVVESLVQKITDTTLVNCVSEIILGIAPYNSVIIDDANLTRKDRLAYINLIREIEKINNQENFFKIIYVYFQDLDCQGVARRIQEDKGLGEEHWWAVQDWQMRRIEVPSHQEIKEYNVELVTIK